MKAVMRMKRVLWQKLSNPSPTVRFVMGLHYISRKDDVRQFSTFITKVKVHFPCCIAGLRFIVECIILSDWVDYVA